jgi:hypothetical protein
MAETVIPFHSTTDHPTRRALLAGAALVAPAAALPAIATLDRLAGRTVA